MTLSHDETKELIDLVLQTYEKGARRLLFFALRRMKREVPEFYAGVLAHGPGMAYTADQWFSFLCKIPVRDLHNDRVLLNKLSETQREQLPKPAFGA